MKYLGFVLSLVLAASLALGQDENLVFRSDVILVRVDAQVVDRDNRPITGLRLEDFILRDEGRPQPIRSFAREEMPLDVLMLFDVSSSMRPHVQRVVSAAHQAFNVLGKDDRVGVMVFDRSSRLRLPFRQNRAAAESEMDSMLYRESFNGGTDITRALVDAANYVGREGRRDARRAIVILTDDETELRRSDAEVLHALTRAEAVLSALIAPAAQRGPYGGGRRGGGYPGGGYPGGGHPGGGYPGGGHPGGGYPGGGYPGGGRRGGGYPGGSTWPGGGWPGSPFPVPGGSPIPGATGGGTRSAGTREIAERSGGDWMPVDLSSGLETVLSRLRQRYALHFNVPPGARAGQERTLDVQLSAAAFRRYPDAQIRFRRTYIAPSNVSDNGAPPQTTQTGPPSTPAESAPADGPTVTRRRRAVSDGSAGSRVVLDERPPAAAEQPASNPPSAEPDPGESKRWRRVSEPIDSRGPMSAPGSETPKQEVPAAAPKPAESQKSEDPPKQGGWRKLKPGEQPY